MSVTLSLDLTAAMVAENVALVALAETETVEGTWTEVLLLDNETLRPPLGAALVKVTLQESLPAAE